MTDQCPVCGDGTLRIVDARKITWTARCDVCGETVELTDTDIEYERDYETPEERRLIHGYLLILIVCFLLAAVLDGLHV